MKNYEEIYHFQLERVVSIVGLRALLVGEYPTSFINGLKKLGIEPIKADLNAIDGCEILVVRSNAKVTEEVIRKAKDLKAIVRFGVSLDNIDVEAARRRGIRIINSDGASSQSVAELTIMLMLAVARRVKEHFYVLENGIWKRLKGFELYGKTLGIIGYGRIGSRVAEIARTFGMRVIVNDVSENAIRRAKERGFQVVSYEKILGEANIITFHVPLNDRTYHMFGEEEVDSCREGLILINTSRGGVVDGKALLRGLNEWKIFGAGLDTLENEPPKEPWEFELIRHHRVIVTPHIGASTFEAQERISLEIIRKLEELLRDGE